MDELSVAEPTSQFLTDPAGPVELPPPEPVGDATAQPPRGRTPWLSGVVTAGVLAICVSFVWLQLNPHLLLANNTPTGGDMGAHVWGPAYLRDHLLPHFRLTGWANDWYDGFPAYQYYMVVPALAVVALNAVVPYGIAFKLITVSGLLMLPVGAYVMGRLFRLRFPGPALLAVATLPFLFDTSFTIYGGNIASTLAGEFAFTISLVLLLLYLGFLARGLESGRYRVITAVLFALVALCHPIPLLGMASLGTLSILAWHLGRALFAQRPWPAVRSTLWWVVSTLGLGSALSAFWIVPFLMRHTYFNDMGWDRLPTSRSRMLYYLLHFGNETGKLKGLNLLSTVPLLWMTVLALALVGVVLSWAYRHQLGCVLSMVAVGLFILFWQLPQGWLWNARLLPFWYLTLYFLAAIGVYHVVQVARSTPIRALILVGALGLVLISVSLPIGVLPGSRRTADGRWSTMGLKAKESFVKSWAKWNYSGYEGKDAYPEYYQVVTKMTEIGKNRGCGRTLWEYDSDRLNAYGTPMSLMMLPYWTNGCIGSQEGLYFEASSTTPYHFLMQSELSSRPSRPQRKLNYNNLDLSVGVKHLQLMGVRYYMAFTERAVSEASHNPDLTRIDQVVGDLSRVASLKASPQPDQAAIDRASPWVIFEVKNAPLVQPLQFQPVVVTDVNQHQTSWLQPSATFFNDPSRWDPFPAATGPASWPRGTIAPVDLPRKPVNPAVISNIKTTDSGVSFNVDKQSLGSPVLVKVSYFPNWHVNGGRGPYRVMPNLMVVVPTSTTVKLSYGYTPVDALGWGLTVLALVGLAILFRRPALTVARPPENLSADGPSGPGGDGAPGAEADWLTGARDPNLGWLWAAPDQPLEAPAPPLTTAAPGHTWTDHEGRRDGNPLAPPPVPTPASSVDGPPAGPMDAPPRARTVPSSTTNQVPPPPPPPPPLPGRSDRTHPAIYDQPLPPRTTQPARHEDLAPPVVPPAAPQPIVNPFVSPPTSPDSAHPAEVTYTVVDTASPEDRRRPPPAPPPQGANGQTATPTRQTDDRPPGP
jgi:hypothetical protein